MAGFAPYYPAPLFGTYKPASFIQGTSGVGTSATLGNNTLRICAMPIQRQVTAIGMFGEFTVAGDGPSLIVMTLYADDGTGFPGALLVNGGSISTGAGNAGTIPTGGTPGVYSGAITPLVLNPALYWIGGVIQGVTVTQPTMRAAFWENFNGAINVLPTAGQSIIGYSVTAAGAPPNPFPAFGTAGTVGTFPRIGLQLQ